jgi:predicted metal-dependent peptidase
MTHKIIFPGKVKKTGLDVVIVADTSGSMGKKEAQQFFSELESLHMRMPCRTRLIQVDAAIQSDTLYKKGDWKKIEWKGGGGTDFRPLTPYMQEKGYQPDVLIFFTDGCVGSDWPKQDPSYAYYWIMTTDTVAPFGVTIKLDL